MKKLFTLSIFALAANISVAQYAGQVASNLTSGGSGDGSAAQINTLLGPVADRDEKTDKKYDEFQGSPYLSNDFNLTQLSYNDENLGTIFYRYNALNEEIEIKKTNSKDEGIRSLARDKSINILVDGKKMSFKTFVTSKKKTLNGYLVTMINGDKYSLYKRTHVKYTEGKAATNSFTKAVPARFTQFTEYYFQKKGVNRMDEVSRKNNKLLKLLEDDDKTKLKVFLKENDLNVKQEADLLKAFEFLNE